MNTTRKGTLLILLICLAIGTTVGVLGRKSKAETTGTTRPASAATDQTTDQTLAPLLQDPTLTSREWDQEIQDMEIQMDKTHARMDKMLDQISAQFRNETRFSGFPQNSAYSLSLNVEDLRNRYVVRAFLPDVEASNVKLKLENNQTLQMSVSNHQNQRFEKNNEAAATSEFGRYEQFIQLPSPVKSNEMKIVRDEHELLITLPKA